jgi:2-C-methyl-D-erythritol 4-phosphate cytidylyltransferase
MTNHTIRVSAILLAGGTGTRMNSQIPKQYITLGNKAIAQYSFDCLSMVPEISEIIVVCENQYRHLFDDTMPDIDISFAIPGCRRQDSVFNGFQAMTSKPDIVCIHDAARPFITPKIVKRVLDAAHQYGAATTGMPVKYTVKEVTEEQFVAHTPDRSKIWEIQTPQALRPQILEQGFRYVNKEGITVTDDVALAEQLKLPVKLVEGDYSNIKITTPEDLSIAEEILKKGTFTFSENQLIEH